MMYVPFYEKETANKGRGVFTSQFIPKGTLIWKLTDTKKYTKNEWEKLPDEIKKDAYPDSGGNFIVAGGKGESWNHSCDANTWWTGDNELSAKRDIQKDEELTYDYATTDIDESKGTESAYTWKCECGSKNCRKQLHWNDILKPEIYNLYKGHLPSWVEKFVEKNNKINILLKRTNLNLSFDEFLKDVQSKFTSLGNIENCSPINEGYEDANFILNATTGKCVLKIFLSERKIENINSYVKILRECKSVGVPTTEILTDFNDGLGFTENNNTKTYYIITKFFEGNNFQNTTPTIEDIKIVTSLISKLNTLNFDVISEYDSWGIKSFAKEYEIKKDKLTPDQNLLIKNGYEDYLEIDMKNFAKSVIHGDMQRKHVIKNSNGEYCILDFGCMAYDYKVIELATYLAWFSLQEDTWKDKDLIYKEVVDIYNSTHHLSDDEIKTIPTLIKVSYSAYFMTTSVMINEGDKSEETLDWHRRSKRMLELTKDWNPI